MIGLRKMKTNKIATVYWAKRMGAAIFGRFSSQGWMWVFPNHVATKTRTIAAATRYVFSRKFKPTNSEGFKIFEYMIRLSVKVWARNGIQLTIAIPKVSGQQIQGLPKNGKRFRRGDNLLSMNMKIAW